MKAAPKLLYLLLAVASALLAYSLLPDRHLSDDWFLVIVFPITLGGMFVAFDRFFSDEKILRSDTAYLYYLGITGGRLFLFLIALGFCVFLVPSLRVTSPWLVVTIGFLVMMGVEVTFFLRKLRRIS